MSENTFTFQDLIESEAGNFVPAGAIKEAVTKTVADTQDSILDGIVPAEWKKPIGKLIDRFADHPEKFENTFLGSLAGKPATPTQKPQPQLETAPQPEQPVKTNNMPDFETLYGQIMGGIEKVIDLQGDMPLSEILKELQEGTYKPLLKQVYDGWVN